MTEAVRLAESRESAAPDGERTPSVVTEFPGPTGGRQLLYLPGFAPRPERKLSLVGRFLVWLGDHPNIVIATVVHVVLFVGLFSLVVQEEQKAKEKDVIEIAISMDDAFDDNTQDEPDMGAGMRNDSVVRPVEAAGIANDSDAATNAGGMATAPEPTDWNAPSETGTARVRAAERLSGIGGSPGGEGVAGSGDTGAGSSSGGYSMRGDGRAAGVARNGGTAASESAVDAGLKWLAAHQHVEDHRESGTGHIIRLGWWRPKEFPDDARDLDTGEKVRYPGTRPSGEVGNAQFTVGLTALCTLAFQGAGNTPNDGPYAHVVAASINWLLREQDHRGSFGSRNMYNHALATIAVAECMVMTKDDALRPALGAAVQYLLNTQNANGGWDYTPSPTSPRNDTSITSWCQMALKAAHAAGIPVPRTAWLRLIHHYRRVSTADGYTWYADRRRDDFRQGMAMVATSAFCRLALGAPREDHLMRQQMSLLLSELPDSKRIKSRGPAGLDQSYYTWYIGTLAAFFHGGEEWNRWNAAMRETAISMQKRRGHLRGSWDGLDKWSWAGGRLYATAMMVLTLEIYYRYVPDYFLADARALERFHDPRKLYAILGEERRNDRVIIRDR